MVTIRSSAGRPASHAAREPSWCRIMPSNGLSAPSRGAHSPRDRLALALAAIPPPPLGTLPQPRRVQLRLHPGVAPAEAVIAHQILVEMLHVPTPVHAPVQLQHQLGRPRPTPLA